MFFALLYKVYTDPAVKRVPPIHLIDATNWLSISPPKQIRLKKVKGNVFCPSCVQTSWPPRGDAWSERPGNHENSQRMQCKQLMTICLRHYPDAPTERPYPRIATWRRTNAVFYWMLRDGTKNIQHHLIPN